MSPVRATTVAEITTITMMLKLLRVVSSGATIRSFKVENEAFSALLLKDAEVSLLPKSKSSSVSAKQKYYNIIRRKLPVELSYNSIPMRI